MSYHHEIIFFNLKNSFSANYFFLSRSNFQKFWKKFILFPIKKKKSFFPISHHQFLQNVYTFKKFWLFNKAIFRNFFRNCENRVKKCIHKFRKIGKFVKFFSENSENSKNFQEIRKIRENFKNFEKFYLKILGSRERKFLMDFFRKIRKISSKHTFCLKIWKKN